MSAFDAAVCPPGIYGCVQSLWEYGHELLSTVMPAITIDFEAVLCNASKPAEQQVQREHNHSRGSRPTDA